MASPNYTKWILQEWFLVAIFALLGLVLALIISFLQPLKYSSSVRLLVLQDVGSTVDAFAASRSEERIADILSSVVFTTTFFNQVMESGFNIDRSDFPEDDFKRRREWGKTVSATVVRGTGLLSIEAFHEDPAQAEQIARAVASVLTERAGEYTSGANIRVRLIDDPLNSRWPVRPNLIANGLSGMVLGFLAGIGVVIAQGERVRRRHQLIHEDI